MSGVGKRWRTVDMDWIVSNWATTKCTIYHADLSALLSLFLQVFIPDSPTLHWHLWHAVWKYCVFSPSCFIHFNTRLAKAATVFRCLDNVWRCSTLSLKIKLDLYTSLIVIYSHIRQRDLEEYSKNTPAAGRLPPTQPAEDFGHNMEGPRDKSGSAEPDRAAKITGHCSREMTSNGRPHHQDATWMSSQSRHVMDPSW